MTAPKRFGGFEADFLTQCEVLAEVARGSPSASWVSTILSAMSWLVSGFPDETQEEVFATRDPRVTGVFSPTGTAVRKNGGYVVSGRWGYNTGGHGGNWTVVNAVLMENGVAGTPHCCLVRSNELERLDDWHASGMQMGEAALAIDSSDAHMRLACALLDAANGAPSKFDRVKLRAHVGATTRYAREAVDGLFYASGASVIQANVPMQSFQRDMQALANHAIMHPQTNVELYGRVLCGLEPNTFLY